jgi:hypothetical protein
VSYRIWPGMLSMAMAWPVPMCTRNTGGGMGDGYAGASAGGVAGTISGSAGTVSSAGGSAGSHSIAGGAGLGAGGAGGEAGLSSAGSAGRSGGAGDTSIAGSGVAGTAGAGGQNGGGTGGTAGAGGAQAGFTLSQTLLSFFSMCVFTPQTLTITNTSNVPLTWHASGNLSAVLLTPSGSTLQPGDGVSVSVLPQIQPGLGSVGSSSVVSIDADVAPSQSIEVTAQLTGKPAPSGPLPPDIDFGNVPVGSAATAFVPVNSTPILVISSETTPEFSLSGAAPNFQGTFGNGWTVTFQPAVAGAAQATLAFTDFSLSTCPPNTISARGTGIVAGTAGCAMPGIPFGTPCGTNQVCALLPTPAIACVTELTLVGSPVTSAPGSLFSGAVASGTAASGSQFAAFTASIDWGDQTVSAGSIVPTFPPTTTSVSFTVTGSHSYASTGSFQGTVTVTDGTTHFSAETTFTASN